MRAFIAIPLPAECRSMLDRMQKELRSCDAEVRWVSVSSIHLTLKFLGEVDPEIIPGLGQSLETAAGPHPSFELTLRGWGCFPGPGNPRVLWCGIEGQTDALLRLQRSVEATCERFSLPPENRDFKPHLTLGRVKGKRNLQPLMDCIKIGSGLQSRFKADHFNIYRSTLRPQGAVYSVLNTISLRG